MICRLYAAHPEEADNQPVTRTHAAAQQGQPAHQRSDDQKQTEVDQRVVPIQHRPECRQDAPQQQKQEGGQSIFDGLAEGVQSLMKVVLFLHAATHQPGGECPDEPVSFCQFDDAVAQQHSPERQLAGQSRHSAADIAGG